MDGIRVLRAIGPKAKGVPEAILGLKPFIEDNLRPKSGLRSESGNCQVRGKAGRRLSEWQFVH
ncbi:MAG TPA: hypothetical protein VGF55_26975, partial [Gemmataceae bacterium]